MSESLLGGLKDQYQELEGRLNAAQDPTTRETVKRDLIALFKRVDGALNELGQLRDGIRGLAEPLSGEIVERVEVVRTRQKHAAGHAGLS